MERSEVKQILKEKGLDEKLLEMPAIVELVYQNALNNEMTVEELNENEELVVSQNRDFIVDKRMITLCNDGTISIGDVIKINQYGIEESCEEGNSLDIIYYTERRDGKIIEGFENSGNCTSGKNVYLDNGAWSLDNAKGILLETTQFEISNGTRKTYEVKLEDLDEEKILAEFETVSASVIKDYPQTSEWYAITKENIKEQIQTKKAEINKRIQEERDPDRLIAENEQLKIQNEKLTKMLERTLNFIENVKKHPLGKIFFHKKIEEFDRNTNTLDAGKER